MKRYTPDSSTNNYVVPEYSDAVDGPGAFKAFADGLDEQHIVPIKDDVAANANDIDKNETSINALANRLDALENTTLSAEWTIRTDGGSPNSGEVSLDSDVWASVTVLNFSLNDKNGVTHDFSNVKPGDTIQVGVGPDAKAAGSSAAYTVSSVAPSGELGVTHLSSTGSPTTGFTAIVAVYPQFDPSSYATKSELDNVEADKLSKGVGLVAATAKVLEDAINTNKDNLATEIANRQEEDQNVLEGANAYTDDEIAKIGPSNTKFDRGTGDLDYADAVVLGQAVTTNKGNISDNAANIISNKVDIDKIVEGIGGTVNPDGGINLPDPIDISGKLDKGTGLVAKDAKELEDAIGTNATNIESNKTDIDELVVNIGGTVNPDGSINLPNGGKPIDISGKYDAGVVPDGETRTYDDAYALEQAVETNAGNISTNSTNIKALVEVLGGNIDNIENIQIDALPPQDGKGGLFLTTDGDEASWAAPKTGDIALSADDADTFVVVDELGTFEDQSDVNTFIAEKGLFKGTMITWGDIANKTA